MKPVEKVDNDSKLGKPKKSKDSSTGALEFAQDKPKLVHSMTMNIGDKKISFKNELKHAKTRTDNFLPPIIAK